MLRNGEYTLTVDFNSIITRSVRVVMIIFKIVRIYSFNTFPYAKAFLFYILTCLIFTKPY
jgi:hypothetical protein